MSFNIEGQPPAAQTLPERAMPILRKVGRSAEVSPTLTEAG